MCMYMCVYVCLKYEFILFELHFKMNKMNFIKKLAFFVYLFVYKKRKAVSIFEIRLLDKTEKNLKNMKPVIQLLIKQ